MPRAKKTMGINAVVSVLIKFIHPSALIRDKYTNPQSGDRLRDCSVTGKCTKLVSRRDQVVITFTHEDFEGELYAVERYCRVEEEGPSDSFFSINETVVEAQVVEEAVDNTDEASDAVDKLIARLSNLRTGGEIDYGDAELNNSGIVVENDNDPLPENYRNVSSEECVYTNWGHSGICHRRQIAVI